MFIFSRYRAPWVAPVFIAVLVLGAFFSWQESQRDEAAHVASERTAFVEFEKKAQEALKLTDEQKASGLLFEAFKCRRPAPSEKAFCDKVADKFFRILSPEQREAFKPLVLEYFSQTSH